MVTDFGRTASDYARHRAGFPEVFFERLFSDGSVRKGDAVLDLGTGTGTVARGLALRGCESPDWIIPHRCWRRLPRWIAQPACR